jgi:hypothetical protein
MRDYSEKPKGDQIRISLDSGANIKSRHDAIVEPVELGFVSKQEWDDASDRKKLEAVQAYFNGNGYPEYSWDDEASCRQ